MVCGFPLVDVGVLFPVDLLFFNINSLRFLLVLAVSFISLFFAGLELRFFHVGRSNSLKAKTFGAQSGLDFSLFGSVSV